MALSAKSLVEGVRDREIDESMQSILLAAKRQTFLGDVMLDGQDKTV